MPDKNIFLLFLRYNRYGVSSDDILLDEKNAIQKRVDPCSGELNEGIKTGCAAAATGCGVSVVFMIATLGSGSPLVGAACGATAATCGTTGLVCIVNGKKGMTLFL